MFSMVFGIPRLQPWGGCQLQGEWMLRALEIAAHLREILERMLSMYRAKDMP